MGCWSFFGGRRVVAHADASAALSPGTGTEPGTSDISRIIGTKTSDIFSHAVILNHQISANH
jgi:hypothetical protein